MRESVSERERERAAMDCIENFVEAALALTQANASGDDGDVSEEEQDEETVSVSLSPPKPSRETTKDEEKGAASFDGIKCYATISDALKELDARRSEASKPRKVPLINQLLEEALGGRGKRPRNRKKYDDYITGNGEGEEESIIERFKVPPRRKGSTNLSSESERRKTGEGGEKGKGIKRKKNRTVVLNLPPRNGTKLDEKKGRYDQYVLPGGQKILLKGPSDPFIGVDQHTSGRYRARFASQYQGRYGTAEEAARAHDLAALAYVLSKEDNNSAEPKAAKKVESREDSGSKGHATYPPASKKVLAAKATSSKQPSGTSALNYRCSKQKQVPSWLHENITDSYENPYELLPQNVFTIAGDGPCVMSCECSVSLDENDVALSATRLTVKLPERMVAEISKYDVGQNFATELMDENGERMHFGAHLLSVTSGFLCLFGQWGQYSRSRQLSASDQVHIFLSLHASKHSSKIFRTPTVGFVGRLLVKRKVSPSKIFILEHNVESECDPEDLGFCYISGRLGQNVIKNQLKRIRRIEDLPQVLQQEQDLFQKINYRMRVVPVGSKKGLGVWLLQSVPAGDILFEYAGEVVSQQIASFREISYLSKYFSVARRVQENRPPHYIYEILPQEKGLRRAGKAQEPPKPLVILDSTYFGNVSRFVNHRCNDPNLEVQHITVTSRSKSSNKQAVAHRIVFRAKRNILPGEELTVDYAPGKSEHELRKTIKCHCGSGKCRGFVF